MTFLKLVFGAFFFVLGWIYLYKPNLVLQVNRIAREKIFSDRLILLERKKLAILFFCLSFVGLYMGMTSLIALQNNRQSNIWIMKPVTYQSYLAMQDFCAGRYESALQKYRNILKEEPDNMEALKRMAYTYAAMGDRKNAVALWKQLLQVRPDNKEAQNELKKIAPQVTRKI